MMNDTGNNVTVAGKGWQLVLQLVARNDSDGEMTQEAMFALTELPEPLLRHVIGEHNKRKSSVRDFLKPEQFLVARVPVQSPVSDINSAGESAKDTDTHGN